MPALDPETNLRFLISCVKHSNGGRPDFEAVAKDQEVVSKAAAAKRYERLLKSVASFKPEASGSASTPTATAAEGDDQDSTGGTPVKKTPKKRAAAKSASKKTPTKRAKKSNNNGGEGDGEKGDGKKGDGKKGDNGDDTPATPASNKKKATPARKRAPAKKAPVAVKSQEIVKNETDSELSDPPPEVPYKSVNNEEGNDNNGACMKVEEKDNDTDDLPDMY